ncbi:DUF262 domain-containing protein [Marinomonas algicola]|uniref:DUF262 domain-containing protein n=1 Tax=Marinomonas algicola TaxID=2773454 RepID=UPI00174D35DD|nr:DUF262 domain-containing protein [Marinomonas algicola]
MDKHFESIATVVKISDFLSCENYAEMNLEIPFYQRPYRWGEKNITDLITDLSYQTKRLSHSRGVMFNADNAYRLGTVVLHKNSREDKEGEDKKGKKRKSLDVVDGQQRSLTLLLVLTIAKAGKFSEQLKDFIPVDIKLPNCSETQKNVSKNHTIIQRFVNSPDFTEDVLDFLLNHCEVVQVTLNELSEAFQFFDSQNARGLDLNPHDLLKAFHLREFPESENAVKQEVVEYWERQDTTRLKNLFANYLYPARRWSAGQRAMGFTKAKAGLFKGVSLGENNYPFQQGLRVIDGTIDSYIQHPHRKLDLQPMAYPFQLTQTMINGRRFFEWVTHYQMLIKPLLKNSIAAEDNNWLQSALYHHDTQQKALPTKSIRPTALVIMQVLNNKKANESGVEGEIKNYSYEGRWRQGDRYVRRMFDALVLCYYDRFGTQDLPRAIEYIFIWAYSLRLEKGSVYLQGIEKHVRENNLFVRLHQSLTPADFLNKPLPQIEINLAQAIYETIEKKNIDKLCGIKILFSDLGYCSPTKEATPNVQ